MSVSPAVSVVIPTYNRAVDLKRALNSVLEQSFSNWEVLVVDNHSNDATDSVVNGFNDSRITLYKIHNRGIIAASRNKGIKNAKGKYVAFLDSDDWWAQDKLKASLLELDRGADLVYHDVWNVTRGDQTMFKEKIISKRPTLPLFSALLCEGMSIPNSSVVVRRDLLLSIGGITEDESLITAEDYDTWIRLSRVTKNFRRTPGCLTFYWNGGGNLSSASAKQISVIRALYAKHINALPAHHRKMAEGFLAYRVGLIAERCGNYELATHEMLKAIRHPIEVEYVMKAIYRLLRSAWLRVMMP